MNAPSGPPEPIKPALDPYGDVLKDAGWAQEAAEAYAQQLQRTPNRTPTVKGLVRAKEKSVAMTGTATSAD